MLQYSLLQTYVTCLCLLSYTFHVNMKISISLCWNYHYASDVTNISNHTIFSTFHIHYYLLKTMVVENTPLYSVLKTLNFLVSKTINMKMSWDLSKQNRVPNRIRIRVKSLTEKWIRYKKKMHFRTFSNDFSDYFKTAWYKNVENLF